MNTDYADYVKDMVRHRITAFCESKPLHPEELTGYERMLLLSALSEHRDKLSKLGLLCVGENEGVIDKLFAKINGLPVPLVALKG